MINFSHSRNLRAYFRKFHFSRYIVVKRYFTIDFLAFFCLFFYGTICEFSDTFGAKIQVEKLSMKIAC